MTLRGHAGALTAERRERMLAFAVVTVALVALIAPERGYVPIWDGRVYADCAMAAAARGLSFDSLRCGGHPSQAYSLLLALSQRVRLGDVSLMHLTNLLLGLLALGSIRVLLSRVFPAREHARQLDLVTLACAVHPVVLSTLLQVNIDFGVYVFTFAALAALLSGKFGWMAIAGTFLCFSKETGVLAYLVMTGLWGAFLVAWEPGEWRERLRRLRPLWVTMVPLALFAAHLVWWNSTHPQSAVWKHAWQQGTLDGFVFFDLSEPVFRSYASGIFLLGFMWVVTALIGADLVTGGVRMARRLADRPVPGADARVLAFVSVFTAVLTYLLTSFRTWSNLRYFAVLYPLLVVLAFAALLRLGTGARLRSAALAVITALFVLAAFRSVDPVSRAVYGTFSTGGRLMYRMASITEEYPGPGRDELVYNLEFTAYHHLQNALFARLRPTDSTAFATARSERWHIWSRLDDSAFRRTLRPERVVIPRYWDDVNLLESPARPSQLYFVDFSFGPDSDSSLASLAGLYREKAIIRISTRGHTLVAHELELRTP